MDNYQGYTDFITYYEVNKEENQIQMNFADGRVSQVLYSEHNHQAMEERLKKQHQTIMAKVLPQWEQQTNRTKIASLPMIGLALLCFSCKELIASLYPLLLTAKYGQMIYKNSKYIQRLRLTDECLKNANALTLTRTKAIPEIKLSEEGKKALEQDGGFSLNHSHLYTNQDLKELTKVIQK